MAFALKSWIAVTAVSLSSRVGKRRFLDSLSPVNEYLRKFGESPVQRAVVEVAPKR